MLIVKGGERLPEPDVIPTPSFGLNYALGGGIWSGRINVIWGNKSAGKSTLTLHMAAIAQEMGYTPVIVDAEKSYSDAWAEKCGVDTENRIVLQANILEDILKYILPLMREKEHKYFFIIDSVNTIVMEQFYKADDSNGAIGIYARSQGVMMQKVANELTVNHCFVLIAQQTITAKGQYFVNAGKFGNAVDHWATNIIRIMAGDASDDNEKDVDDKILNRKVTWRADKSKQMSIQGMKGDYWFSPQNAFIDQKKEAVHLAVRNGIVEKNGAWFVYNGEKHHGMPKLLEALGDEDIDSIMDQLNSVEEWDFDYEEVE